MYIMAATIRYGRVKVVGGTPIVTQFAMLQPLWKTQIKGPNQDSPWLPN